MGLGISRFIAANNENDVFLEYLQTGKYNPRPSVQTYANAMDVGAPSNFARIMELYNNDHKAVSAEISGFKVSDKEILETIRDVYEHDNYIPDPHGACAYRALKALIKDGETGVFLETAHPAKFGDGIKKAMKPKCRHAFRLFSKAKRKARNWARISIRSNSSCSKGKTNNYSSYLIIAREGGAGVRMCLPHFHLRSLQQTSLAATHGLRLYCHGLREKPHAGKHILQHNSGTNSGMFFQRFLTVKKKHKASCKKHKAHILK